MLFVASMSGSRIALITDVHFGRIASPDIVASLVADVAALKPDVVVVGGDLTQRARKRELKAAAKLIADLGASIVIPGNHDVFAWWFPIRRLTDPLARYRQYISADVNAELVTDDLAILALNSSMGWTIKSGRFDHAQLKRAEEFFRRTANAEKKVLVVHHHLFGLPNVFSDPDVAVGGSELLDLALEWGADAVLCGHLHLSHAQVIQLDGRSTVMVSSGTATSNRGRGADASRNVYELVTITGETIRVDERVFSPRDSQYQAGRSFAFSKVATGWQDVVIDQAGNRVSRGARDE